RRRDRPRLDWRARPALSARDRRLRRREPGRSRRPQHPRAGDLRQADRLRAAHAELPRDRRDLHRQRRGDSDRVGARSGRRDSRSGPRSRPPSQSRRGGARAGRSQPRRQREDALRHQRSPAAGRWCREQRPSVPAGALGLPHALSTLYGAGAAWRRRWYVQHPERRRRLDRPVISVGNIRVGGSGKTPIVDCIARVLADAGYKPAVLSRGYGRKSPSSRPTVVSDGRQVVATIDTAGDEPLMLARSLVSKGVSVVVGADRYACGRVAESQLNATVHILDDGFQDAAERIGRDLRVRNAYHITRSLLPPRMVDSGDTVVVPNESRVFAFAGIARPERFFADLTSAGWDVVGTKAFRDHHRFTGGDISRVAAAAKKAGAAIVLTTEKDAVRVPAVPPVGPMPMLLAAVPLVSKIEPADEFRAWLLGQIR